MGIGTMSRGEKAVIYVDKDYLTQCPLLPSIELFSEIHFVVELVHFIQVIYLSLLSCCVVSTFLLMNKLFKNKKQIMLCSAFCEYPCQTLLKNKCSCESVKLSGKSGFFAYLFYSGFWWHFFHFMFINCEILGARCAWGWTPNQTPPAWWKRWI